MGCTVSSEQNSLITQIFDPTIAVINVNWSNNSNFFITQNVLREIVENRHKVTTPLIAAKIGAFLEKFCSGQSFPTPGQAILIELAPPLANQLYLLVVDHCIKLASTETFASSSSKAKVATTGQEPSCTLVARAISAMCFQNPITQHLFTNPNTAVALDILLKSKNACATLESANAVASAVYDLIEDNPEGQRLFASLAQMAGELSEKSALQFKKNELMAQAMKKNNKKKKKNSGNDDDDEESEDEENDDEETRNKNAVFITNRETRAAQFAVFQFDMKNAPSIKAFIEKLDKDDLRELLISRNVAECVIKAIHGEGYRGAEFVLDSFVKDAFEDDEEVQKKYGVKKLHIKALAEIRTALFSSCFDAATFSPTMKEKFVITF